MGFFATQSMSTVCINSASVPSAVTCQDSSDGARRRRWIRLLTDLDAGHVVRVAYETRRICRRLHLIKWEEPAVQKHGRN